jgi:hypothetical protein
MLSNSAVLVYLVFDDFVWSDLLNTRGEDFDVQNMA